MKSQNLTLLLLLMSFAILLPSVQAHIPVASSNNDTLETALHVTDHWKSWFYYSELGSNEIHYYEFEVIEGERIRLIISVPITDGDAGFQPGLVLMGSGITDQGVAPSNLETPSGVGVMVLESSELVPEYEGFTPLALYETVDLNMTAPASGTYYAAVFHNSNGGNYALVTGYVESYSLLEWISVPFMVITILEWTGQSVFFILLLMLFPLIIGMSLILYTDRKKEDRMNTMTYIGVIGALLMVGSGNSTLIQMMIALMQAPPNWTTGITPVFAVIQFLLGLFALKLVSQMNPGNKRGGILLILIGLTAPLIWAGLLVGPILVILVGIIHLRNQF